MKKLFFLSLLIPLLGAAQSPYYASGNLISSSTTVTLSATTEAFTIQQPASVTHSFSGQQVIVSCSTTTICAFDIELNSSVATSTTHAVNSIAPGYSPQMQAFDQSNAGAGAIIGQYILGLGGTISVDISKVSWPGTYQFKNLTVRFGSTTGQIAITVLWAEN